MQSCGDDMGLIPFLRRKRKEKKFQPVYIDIEKMATKEELAKLRNEMLEARRNLIWASLSPRMKRKILDIRAKQKGGQNGKSKK
jgi:hypothetical protein